MVKAGSRRRETLGLRSARQIGGFPDGIYVVIQFKTSFANKQTAVETVTPTLEKDGCWRVFGYYI